MQISSVLSNCLRFQILMRYIHRFPGSSVVQWGDKMCFQFIADRLCPGWHMEGKWKTTHGRTDSKNWSYSTGCHLQQVFINNWDKRHSALAHTYIIINMHNQSVINWQKGWSTKSRIVQLNPQRCSELNMLIWAFFFSGMSDRCFWNWWS